MREPDGVNLFGSGSLGAQYVPRRVRHFEPERIVIAKGSLDGTDRAGLVERICALYPDAQVVKRLDVPHNHIELAGEPGLTQHYRGKRTLVFGVHNSAVRNSDEDANACPSYWHFSPYGFCPYDCQYCYLAGTPGVRYSPTIKIFVNLPEILARMERIASTFNEPASLYLGKLQDGLALDPLTGYSRVLVPFFARQRHARFVLLTKSDDVENLLDLDHNGHTILSWSLNPPEISAAFERNVPSPTERLAAMKGCAKAGYIVRAVLMPIIPIAEWQTIYATFLDELLTTVPLQRITLGQICSYSGALALMEDKVGRANPISRLLDRRKCPDGRTRFPAALRVPVYRFLIDHIRNIRPDLDIGLCLEQPGVFDALDMQDAVGRCNCRV
jgi:spore photoproduct lyase